MAVTSHSPKTVSTAPAQTKQNVQNALNLAVLDDLRPLSVGVMFFYIVYTTIEVVDLPLNVLIPILAFDILVMVAFLSLRIALDRDRISAKWANPVAAAMGGLILANTLVTFYVLQDSFVHYYVLIVVIGITYFLLSIRWWLIATLAYIAAWFPVALLVTPRDEMQNFVLGMLAAVVLSATIQVTRLKTQRRIENLRLQELNNKRRLESALEAARNEIAERQRAEEEKKQLEDQLWHTQKMEAIGRLAGGIAHDMNNVLAAIMGSASAIDSETEQGDAKREDVDNILTACTKGRDLTRDLLGFAHKGKYVNEKVSLNSVADEVRALLSRTFPKKIETEFHLDERLSCIGGDPGQIEHALMNVCINARDAMNGEGKLTIITENVSIKPSNKVTMSGLAPGEYVELKVTDTGVGMDRETLKMVFEPFFTTKPKGKGTGLGLAMVYGAIKNHGGMVDIASKVGVGTSVTFILPVDTSDALSEPASSTETTAAQTGSGCILIVDDEAIVRNSSSRLIRKLGYAVFVAESGQAAIDIFEKHRHDISLVLLDQIMPVMDGSETFEKLKQIDPDARILLCSGYSKDEKIDALLTAGAYGFLEKPFEINALSQELSRALS